MDRPFGVARLLLAAGTLLASGIAHAALAPVAVDFSKDAGTIRRLNGVCCATPLSGARIKSIDDHVRRLEIPYFQTHDAALQNPGLSLVDVSRIFPLFHADVDDPRNYDFQATDDYLRQIVDAGATVMFRLGESIEHTKRQYRVNPPPDFAKWAEICVHIIRHYNEGWANGHRWNIRYWSVWEEPDTNPMLLTGAANPFKDVYLPLYAVVSKRIKAEFPDLRVAGPQGCGIDNMKPFVDYCAENKLPLDVYGLTGYSRNPDTYGHWARSVRAYLDAKGYRDTKIAQVEWHWGPAGWGLHANDTDPRLKKAWSDELVTADSGVFAAANLMHMQDQPVDFMYFYAMQSRSWGLFDGSTPLPSYWGMFAFAQLAHGDRRVAAPLHPQDRWWILASKESKTGRGHVLVAALREDGGIPSLKLLGGVRPVSVRVLDVARDLEETPGWKWNAATCEFSVERDVGDSTLWLIDTEPVPAPWLQGTTDKDALSYRAGEAITFTLTLREDDGRTAEREIVWRRTGDDGRVETGRGPADRPLAVTTALDRPGFVRLYAKVVEKGADFKSPGVSDGRGGTLFFDGGAAVSPRTLVQSKSEPKDFDAFWKRQLGALEAVPPKVEREEIASPTSGVRLYKVRLACAGPQPSTGYLSIPAKPGMWPARAEFHGYGYSWGKGATDAPAVLPTDRIHFAVSAHGFELGRDAGYYAAFKASVCTNGYGHAFDPSENARPETCYFRAMALRCIRAVEYLKTLPEWNGRDLAVEGGSQGSLQAMWCAAFVPGVTRADLSIPWGCDFGGPAAGLDHGDWYPAWAPGLDYFDQANVAKRVPATCRVDVSRAGLGDYIAPPHGAAVMFRNLECPKRIVWYQGSEHCYVPPEAVRTEWTR